MKTCLHGCQIALQLAVVILAASRTAADEAGFPRKIVMTQADCEEIDKKCTLRGRPLEQGINTIWNPEMEVWSGLQVFTGRKRDIINWFVHDKVPIEGMGGFRSTCYMRSFQYDMLVSKLLQVDDIDITRAVIRGACPTGHYTLPELERLLTDKRFSTVDRLGVWWRVLYVSHKGNAWKKNRERFWKLFGDEITTDDIIESDVVRHFRWEMFHPCEGFIPPKQKTNALLLPVLRREYLGVNEGQLMHQALMALQDVNGKKDSGLIEKIVRNIVAWDELGDSRSSYVWHGPGAWGTITYWPSANDDTGQMLKGLITAAKVPQNAAEAFFAFAKTPFGKKEIEKIGWQTYFDTYLKNAMSKKTEEKQHAYLRALSGYSFSDGSRTQFHSYPNLVEYIEEGNVDLSAVREHILRKAWGDNPMFLSYLKKKEPKEGEGRNR